jgi:hypothetical protein
MEVTLIGWILIPLSFYLFIFKPHGLYYLTVFFIPFTGTAIFDFSLASVGSQGFRVYMFLGALCLLRHFITVLNQGKLIINKEIRNSLFLLFLFALIVVVSLIMPVIIDGDFIVLEAYEKLITYADEKPLYFKFQFVTQVLYCVFGCFLTYYFAIKNVNASQIEKTLKVYIYASIFVCFWGFLEIFCYYSGLEYPTSLFNHQSVTSAGGFNLAYGMPRLISVSLEPSILSQQLLPVFSTLCWALVSGYSLFSRRRTISFVLIILLALLLAISSTAYLGLLVLGLIFLRKIPIPRKVNYFIYLGILVLVITAVLVGPIFIYYIIRKLSEYSGLERMKALNYGFDYFVNYPILGVGWGVFPTWDIIICILAGTGVIGLFIFGVLILNIFKGLHHQIRSEKEIKSSDINKQKYFLLTAIQIAFILTLAISQVTGFIYHSPYFWFILGIAIASFNLKREKSLQ